MHVTTAAKPNLGSDLQLCHRPATFCKSGTGTPVRSKLAELGVPQEGARKILKHEDSKVDRVYNRYEFMAERRKAMLRLEEGLLGLLGP
jgi:hypothetical protein